VVVAALSFAAVWLGRRAPFVATGWFWFFGMLIPAIGLIQVGDQSMADRYMYLPLFGVFMILVWGAGEVFQWWRVPRLVMGVMAGTIVIACAAATRAQL